MSTQYELEDKQLLVRLGSTIREQRVQSGLSQEVLAFESGLDRTYVGSVERGERNISIINLQKIAKALKTSMCSLLPSDQ